MSISLKLKICLGRLVIVSRPSPLALALGGYKPHEPTNHGTVTNYHSVQFKIRPGSSPTSMASDLFLE